MKAVLEFELPMEAEEHRIALEGSKYSCAVESVFSWIRSKQKYTDLTEKENDLLNELRQFIIDELD